MDENGDRNLIELPVPEGARGIPHHRDRVRLREGPPARRLRGEDLPQGWDQIVFKNCERRDGTPVVKSSRNTDDYPPDLVFPEEAREGETPGANQSARLYATVEEAGVEVVGW